jgi:hypothetical protein
VAVFGPPRLLTPMRTSVRIGSAENGHHEYAEFRLALQHRNYEAAKTIARRLPPVEERHRRRQPETGVDEDRTAERAHHAAQSPADVREAPVCRGRRPITVGEQEGWSDPSFPMKVYARAVKRREKLTGCGGAVRRSP